MDYTDYLYGDIYQDPDYEVIEQQVIEFQASDKIAEGEYDSLHSGREEDSEHDSEGQPGIQAEVEGSIQDYINEVTDAEEANDIIEDYVLNN